MRSQYEVEWAEQGSPYCDLAATYNHISDLDTFESYWLTIKMITSNESWHCLEKHNGITA